MVRPAEGEANKVRCGDFGCGVEGAETGGEAEVGVIEYDEAKRAYEAVEGPENEGGPYVEVMTGRFTAQFENVSGSEKCTPRPSTYP